MIDFTNAIFTKMMPVKDAGFMRMVNAILIPDEELLGIYKSLRDGVVFTNKRIIAANVQGITGKKVDLTSMPYSKVQCFSIESAGVLDLDSELELWFSSAGKIKFEFMGNNNLTEICRMISTYIL
ncbi:MAG: PH domain-containing protein [Eubacteriaceae bacterium]|jgi:hypothetical protein